MNVKLTYGTRSFDRHFAEGSTIGQILTDATVRARLGMPENVTATVDGVTLDTTDTVNENDEVVFEKQAAAKAV